MKTIKEFVLQDLEEKYPSYLEDVCQYGCISGTVNGLIYYEDTIKFYKDHQKEINELLKGLIDDTGMSTSELFGDKFDKSDPLCMDTNNQNLLAWFGYEETARILLDEQENS